MSSVLNTANEIGMAALAEAGQLGAVKIEIDASSLLTLIGAGLLVMSVDRRIASDYGEVIMNAARQARTFFRDRGCDAAQEAISIGLMLIESHP